MSRFVHELQDGHAGFRASRGLRHGRAREKDGEEDEQKAADTGHHGFSSLKTKAF
jgi:hypothetical protein